MLVDTITDLPVAGVSADPSGVIIQTGPHGIEYYNPFLGTWGSLGPENVPVGSTIGIRAYGLNDLLWAQSMTIVVYIYDPDGAQIKTGSGFDINVGSTERVFSGNVQVVAAKPGAYTAKIELYSVLA